MSRDFSPRECWFVNKQSGCDAFLQNITYSYAGKKWDMYTEEELADRKAHRTLAILGADIYIKIKEKLSTEQFEALNMTLTTLVEADENNKSIPEIPEEIINWYFNKNDHYYHEPNDYEFLDYLEKSYK
ncbi:hypothetical protein [Butyrivibrio sp. M55]|jgi:spore coat polysaccharide biosynthesis predicted glycosyltransferase SpsG|uniref:hypothetical protein n=1 Tax=Butyrivibrio sp. M55 TaxID=1855323 RepID=UPI0008E65219|nr:hypothetical protein [Butyrivibrio sp. M55]SFU86453.1 hypothetical protein SAMN05216540_11532 [Butyrivibrio sp. M55]